MTVPLSTPPSQQGVGLPHGSQPLGAVPHGSQGALHGVLHGALQLFR